MVVGDLREKTAMWMPLGQTGSRNRPQRRYGADPLAVKNCLTYYFVLSS
jgi:hypothetical protein